MIRSIRVLLWIFGTGLASAALSQEVLFLAIQGDGSASVIIDAESATAYINDGGRAGARGIAGASIDGQPVLEYLRGERKIGTLIVSCSHPHADHMGGLEAATKSTAILEFERVAFVDGIPAGSVTDSGKRISRLQDVFSETHGELANEKLIRRLDPALDANRFADLELASQSVSVRNYKYDPAAIGESVHDAALIVETEIRANGARVKSIVDFDDASTNLIKQWAIDRGNAPIDVVVMAHHGSRYNDMSPVLARVKAANGFVIFTANDTNRFSHPSPKTLDAAIRAVGVEHVHITGSRFGNNVIVSASGVSRPQGTGKESVVAHINAQITKMDSMVADPLISENLKTRANVHRNALLAIARLYALEIEGRNDTSPTREAGPTVRPAQSTTTDGGRSSSATGSGTPIPSRQSGPTRGSCTCVTYRNGVPVSSAQIPFGARCGAQVCGLSNVR